jgi:hypothetical protein
MIRHLRVKSALTGVLCLCFSSLVKAQYQPVTLDPSSFNEDVVANAPSPASSSVTNNVDASANGNTVGYSFVSSTYRTPSNTAPASYLPDNNLVNSAATSGLSFNLMPYTGNNAMRLASYSGAASTGTFLFSQQVNASTIYILGIGGGGSTTVNFTVTFADNSTQAFNNVSIGDWYTGTNPIALAGVGRVSLSGNSVDAGGPRLYQFPLAIQAANYNKAVKSVTATKTSVDNVVFVALAVSVQTISACVAPASAPTGLALTPGLYSVSGSFTAAAAPGADKYLVLRTPGLNSTPSAAPATGTTYTAGATLGNATVIYAGTATNFTDNAITANTPYTYSVYAYNDVNCYNAAYNSTRVAASTTTLACAPWASGTYTVGPSGNYTSLTAALTALYNAGGSTGNITLELQAAYTSTTETFPIVIPDLSTSPCGGSTLLTIRPAAGATGLSITGSNATAILDLNGSKNVYLDGRPGGTGTAADLKVINTSTTGVALRLVNEASLNVIQYIDFQGQNTSVTSSALSGVVYIGGTTGSFGNDNNYIDHCNIHGTTTGTPAIGLAAYGNTTTVDTYNDNNTISNCNIYDYFNAGVATSGVKIDVGNNAYTITGNNLYQTAARTFTAVNTQRAFWITPNVGSVSNTASNFTVTNNFIGGSAAGATGTAYTLTATVGVTFMGMDLSLGLGTASTIQGNVIRNISLTTTSTSATGTFTGIGTANGNATIGGLTAGLGNFIGDSTGTGSITVTNGSAGTVFGIRIGSGNSFDVTGNNIGSITVNGSSASTSASLTGIGVAGATTININGNLVGSRTTAGSINLATASTSTTGQVFNGISITAGTTTTVTGNTVANISNNHNAAGTATTSRGIYVTSSASAITGNVVRNISSSTNATGGGATSAITGIGMTSTNSAGCNVTGNLVHSLTSSSTAAVNITGIFYQGASGTISNIARNSIHSLGFTGNNDLATVTALDFASATASVVNNMFRLGFTANGTAVASGVVFRGISTNSGSGTNNFYHNSVYIGGTGVNTTARNTFVFNKTTTTGTYDVRNNIFVNARANAAAGGKHYVLYLSSATTTTLNYNDYYVPGTGGVFAYNGSADVAAFATGWLSSDINSIAANPQFIAPAGTAATGDLHISTTAGTPIEGAGTNITAVTDDFDGDTRSGLTPTDIGADAGNFIAADLSAPAISYATLAYTCATTDRTISATLTDASGVASGSLAPRIYYRKNTTGIWASAAGTLTSGTATNGTWNFTIPASTLGLAAGDVVYYYVIAQDVVTPSPNIGANPGSGLVASNVNSVTTHPGTPNSYNVANGPLPTAIVITPANPTACASTNTVAALTATGGTYNLLLTAGTQASQNATTGYPAPFTNYYGGAKHQILILAAELSAAGYSAGTPLVAVNFPVVSLGSSFTSCQNFKVKMGTTTSNVLTSTFVTGLNTVFGPATVNPVVGYNNVLTFTTPFVWDGSSNVVLETSYSNGNSGTSANAVIMNYTSTPAEQCAYYRADGSSATAIETATTATGTTVNRPDFKLTATIAAPITWSPVSGLFTDAAATMPYTGAAGSSVYALPGNTTIYTATATTPNACQTAQQTTVTVNCATPVTLLDFTGARRNGINNLSWTTATEHNNAGFELQSSADGITYGKVTFVASRAADGNSNAQLSYGFEDAKARAVQSTYYRLKQLDKDGRFVYSNTVLLKGEKVPGVQVVSLYPNPVKDVVHLQIASPAQARLTLLVTDMAGRTVAQQQVLAAEGNTTHSVNVAALAAGTYSLKLVCADGCESAAQKFVKY